MSSCCPPGSWPALEAQHTEKFSYQTISSDGLQAYVSEGGQHREKGILLIHDIYGNKGRTLAICDQLSEQLSCVVVAPRLFRQGDQLDNFPEDGNFMQDGPAWVKKYPYADGSPLKMDLDATILFMKQRGVTRIGLIGFCWGSWVIFKMCGQQQVPEEIKCGVSCHPSLALNPWIWGGAPDGTDLAAAVKKQGRPQLLLAGANDPDWVREGGAVIKGLEGTGSRAINFTTKHGWVNRGDVSVPEVKSEVERALTEAQNFLKANL